SITTDTAGTANAAEEASAAVFAEQVKPKPVGPPAPKLKLEDYPRFSLFRSRDAIWMVAQLHLYFAAFIVAVPIFVIVIEGMGMGCKDREKAKKYDRMAHDFMRISITAFAITALLGGLLFFLLLTLFPDYIKYLSGIFSGQMLIYASLFLAESFFLYIYYYGWDAMRGPFSKWLHLSCGLMLNMSGLTLMVLANSWATFAMAPSGVTETGAFLGNVWAAIRGPLWNPVNLHRFIANVALGGAVVAAFAGYRYLAVKTKEEKAYYDWMGYTGMLISVTGLLPLPFAGYWLMREVYAFSQQMGISLMGGLFAWVFIIQALLIGAIFLSVNYYLWLGMGRIRGVKGYQHYIKYMVIVLIGAFLVWFTPHSIVLSGKELKSLGGAHHHYLGFFGVMSAKNTAVNMMIVTSALCFLLYRRGNKIPVVSWVKQGNAAQAALFFMGTVNIIGLGVYGYFLPANIRIGLSGPQVCTTFSCMIISAIIDGFMYKGAKTKGEIVWGEMPAISQYILVGLAMSFAWLMGLMGFIRSSVRQYWHVYAVMRDTSADAYSQTVGYMANFVSLATIIFTGFCVFIFWLAEFSQKGHEVTEEKVTGEAVPELA
ncbi:MAG: cytochrome ubiquinol oxidase subunit I, partial [Nitrospinota bacterium]